MCSVGNEQSLIKSRRERKKHNVVGIPYFVEKTSRLHDATIRGWLLFEVQTSRLLFISAPPQCGDYSRAATIRSTEVAATIYAAFIRGIYIIIHRHCRL